MIQEEAERLELQHRVFNRVFEDRLIFPPVRRPRRVLDCGYGAGTWATDVAYQYPNCDVKSRPVLLSAHNRTLLTVVDS